MTRHIIPAVFVLLVPLCQARAQDPFKPEVIERGKKATALVQTGVLWEGSAFCIDKTGLFVTTAHVLEKALASNAEIKLLLDTGLETERNVRAKLLRRDDRLDLALLQVDNSLKAQDRKDAGRVVGALARSRPGAGFTALDLGNDGDLTELAPIVTLGYPARALPPNGRVVSPPVAVRLNHITALRKARGQLIGIQIDSQLDPRVSGGPVLDSAGRVIGVVAATVRGAAMNLAIPVGRLREFLAAPKIVFDPPPLSDLDRNRQVTWTVKLEPPAQGKLPERLSVAVIVADGPGSFRSFAAQPDAGGVFKVTLHPLPEGGVRGVELRARFRGRGPTVTMRTKDREVTVGGDPTVTLRTRDREISIGGKKHKLSELRVINGGPTPRAETLGGQTVTGPIEGLGQARMRSGRNIATVELRNAVEIKISTYDLPVAEIFATVEAKQDSKVVSTLRQRIKFTAAATTEVARTPPNTSRRAAAPGGPQPAGNDGVLNLAGALDVDGVPRGAGKDIKPPPGDIPPARLTPAVTGAEVPPLERRLEGRIADVAVGGAGRYLLLTLKDARKLAVFDLSAADVVKTIPLSSPNVFVTAGAKKFLIALPDEKRLERWDLETLKRDGDSRPLPMSGPLKALALGSDSDGPALAIWFGEASAFGYIERTRGSFIDLESLAVLRLDAAATRSSQGRSTAPASGGSFAVDAGAERPHLRASAGGGLFGLWQTHGRPNGFNTVVAHGQSIQKARRAEHLGHLVPSPDGRTVYTCAAGRLYADGRFLGRGESLGAEDQIEPELTLPSADPAYYLSISGLKSITINNTSGTSHVVVTVSVRASGDGTRLLTVYGLDEMATADRSESFLADDFTVDKRFHFVPAARLLVTIPLENDRLLLRRLDIADALFRAEGEPLIVTSSPSLLASAGQVLQHRLAAWSKTGGPTFQLASGPEGMSVAPDGALTWNVPRRLKSDEVLTVVKARDEKGQEIFQTLRIHVKGAEVARPAPPPASGAELPPSDDGLLRLGVALNVTSAPLGSGREIRPPRIAIPAACLTAGAEKASQPPLVRQLGGTIGDIAVGGGGRFLFLALKEARKLAVFDCSAGDVVKTIPLSSTDALVAAGANKLLIAFPEQQILERWDLATLEREGGSHVSPIDGWIRALALGSDSDGPALALWYPRARGYVTYLKASRTYIREPEARFSFIDIDRLTVLKAGSIELGKSSFLKESDSLSASGGSFMLQPDLGQRRGYKVYMQASAGGGLFEISVLPMELIFLQAQGKKLRRLSPQGTAVASLALTARGGLTGRVLESIPWRSRPIFIRTADPAYLLGVSGLPENVAGTMGGIGNIEGLTTRPGAVSASIHAAGDGSRLLTVYGLDEMALHLKMSAWFHDDLTIDKRFHFVPAAQLLITIPPSNDRLVLRRLNLDEALDHSGSEQLIILSSATLTASAGSKIAHRIVARSKKGRVTFALSEGPDGLKVAKDGLLTWAVPARLKGQEVTVVVTVSEAAGDERFHTIKILVE